MNLAAFSLLSVASPCSTDLAQLSQCLSSPCQFSIHMTVLIFIPISINIKSKSRSHHIKTLHLIPDALPRLCPFHVRILQFSPNTESRLSGLLSTSPNSGSFWFLCIPGSSRCFLLINFSPLTRLNGS